VFRLRTPCTLPLSVGPDLAALLVCVAPSTVEVKLGLVLCPDNPLPLQYLVLEELPGAQVFVDRTPVRILTPNFPVKLGPSAYDPDPRAVCALEVSQDVALCDLGVCVFNVHPRLRTVQATSIMDRLHLAALHAATGTRLSEARTRMTGGERAAQLLRQCSVNHPYTDLELDRLHNVRQFGGAAAALLPLCDMLERRSQGLAFLHATPAAPAPGPGHEYLAATACGVSEAAMAWATQVRQGMHNPRAWLTRDEQRRVLGNSPGDLVTSMRLGLALTAEEAEAAHVGLAARLPPDHYGLVPRAELLLESLTVASTTPVKVPLQPQGPPAARDVGHQFAPSLQAFLEVRLAALAAQKAVALLPGSAPLPPGSAVTVDDVSSTLEAADASVTLLLAACKRRASTKPCMQPSPCSPPGELANVCTGMALAVAATLVAQVALLAASGASGHDPKGRQSNAGRAAVLPTGGGLRCGGP
jgi:hypothetical protein